MYHLELRQFPHVARAFNLTAAELHRRFVGPWVAGQVIEHDERRWVPERTRLTIVEGAQLRPDQLGLGRGWATATRSGADVTEAVLAQARRGAEARPELDALKAAVAEVAVEPIGCADVLALAAAAHPGWRASEQLALAEQAVWEMLHQSRIAITRGGRPVAPEDWQGVVLSWETWLAAAAPAVRLRACP